MTGAAALDEEIHARGGPKAVVRSTTAQLRDPRPEPPDDEADTMPNWVRSMQAWKPSTPIERRSLR